jgi:3-deoxy-D-manno-octulosonate 8-phosphate phosphatase (KDO 8-P phosphatase)
MNILSRLKKISTFVFDLDGVLTDGSLFVFDSGEQVRRMNVKDGYALQLAIKKGYRVAVISGGDSLAAVLRLNGLGIHDVFMKVANKHEKLEAYRQQQQLSWESILFMGDDIPDYEVMRLAGVSCTTADGAPEIKQIASYISSCKGGEGCARDVIEKVLKLNDHWELELTLPSR